MLSMDVNLASVLIALITAIGGWLSGYRKGRKVYRSGDFKESHSRDMLEKRNDE